MALLFWRHLPKDNWVGYRQPSVRIRMHDGLCRQAEQVEPRPLETGSEGGGELVRLDALEVNEGATSGEVFGCFHEGFEMWRNCRLELVRSRHKAYGNLTPHGAAQ